MSTAQRGRRHPPDLLTLVGYAEELLREMIFSGELPPGTRIYPEEAASKLGMSSIPVREALRGLAARGLVDASARRGFRVRAADSADFAETYDLRLMLDPHAVRLAVPQLNRAALDRVKSTLATFERTITSGDTHSYYADHRAFHFSIYEHCGSRWLLEIISMLWENSQRYQRLSTGPRGTPEERVAEHRAIAEACEDGDPERAGQLMWEHLERTRAVVAKILDGT